MSGLVQALLTFDHGLKLSAQPLCVNRPGVDETRVPWVLVVEAYLHVDPSAGSVGFGFRRYLGRRRVRGVMDRGDRSDVAEEESKVADREAIVRVALDYFEGWFDGDAARMERSLHPDLAKRSPDDAPGPGELEKLTAREMIEATAKGVGRTRDVPDRGIEVEVEHVHREIANVTVRSAVYIEYLHLVRTGDGWKIVNALWQHP